jgi:dTDP-glucose 4,6-dehydratase
MTSKDARTILVTGGCGFIGSNFVRLLLAERPHWHVTNLDLLTYAGNPENLADVEKNPQYRFVQGDISDPALVRELLAGEVWAVVNFAAETHVDRSILDSGDFVRTNVLGTETLLAAALAHKLPRFLQVSTDEVYGSLGQRGAFSEEDILAPSSPYAASKAAADLLTLTFHKTFGLTTLITRSSNNYGPYQFPEKVVPLFITNALADQPLPLYGDGLNVRDWLYVEDNCRAILRALERGKAGSIYNVGGGNELTNLVLTELLLDALGKPHSLIRFVPDRLGHDRRYALDCRKVFRELGWQPVVDFQSGLKQTIQWYVENRPWWERLRSGSFRSYYRRQYGDRLAQARGPETGASREAQPPSAQGHREDPGATDQQAERGGASQGEPPRTEDRRSDG